MVGTGPLILTDYVEGVSKTFTKNPDFWDYDEKYPENRLPYVDEIRALLMADEATRISALRTGKIDIIQHAGVVDIGNMDVIRSLQKTNPEIEVYSYYQRAFQVFGLNIRNAPFDDVRVRHALQMALDLETINDTYFGGFSDWENPAWIAPRGITPHLKSGQKSSSNTTRMTRRVPRSSLMRLAIRAARTESDSRQSICTET